MMNTIKGAFIATSLSFLLVAEAIAAEQNHSELILACAECHGLEGRTQIPGWPAISRMSKSELVGKLKAYRSGVIPESRMANVAHKLSDEQIDEAAEYYSMLKFKRNN